MELHAALRSGTLVARWYMEAEDYAGEPPPPVRQALLEKLTSHLAPALLSHAVCWDDALSVLSSAAIVPYTKLLPLLQEGDATVGLGLALGLGLGLGLG